MQNQIIIPDNEAHWLELRTKDVTSTEAGALFGLSDSSWIPTLFELWHRKKDNITVDFKPNERLIWGKRMEATIALGIAEDNGWKVRRMSEYIRIPELRAGASFDYECTENSDDPNTCLLEIKNLDSLMLKTKWIQDEDGNFEATPSIELQVQYQLFVSGKPHAYIAGFVGGNKVVLIKREADLEIHEAIKTNLKAFWKSIDENIPPEPDFSKDAKTISKLYGYSEPGKIYSAEGDLEILTLATRYKELGEAVKACDIERDGIKSQLLIKVGDSEKVIGDGFSISAGMIGPARVEYDRQGYRTFRINWKREKV